MDSKAFARTSEHQSERVAKSSVVIDLPDGEAWSPVPTLDTGQDILRTLRRGQNRTRQRKMPEAHRERLRLVIYLYRSGASSAEIALSIGVSKQRVLQLLRAAGVERRACGNRRKVRSDGRYTHV